MLIQKSLNAILSTITTFLAWLGKYEIWIFFNPYIPPMLKYGTRPCQKSPQTDNQGQSSHILVILNQIWVLGDF